MAAYLDSADIIISCTASPKYIIEKKDIERLVAQRVKPLLFMDIAVPRDIDPTVAELDNVFLYDIDDMQNVVAQNLEGRQKEAVKARQIVEEEAREFFLLAGFAAGGADHHKIAGAGRANQEKRSGKGFTAY